MKKFLVLMLVLGMASFANAIILDLSADSLSMLPGGSITISIASDTAGISGNYWTYLEENLPSYFTISNLAKTVYSAGPPIVYYAGNIASITDYGTSSFFDMELAANDSGGNVRAGIQFTGTVTASSSAPQGTYTDVIWITGPSDGSYTPVDWLTLTVIPEPATIALLCLGGLLLRKK